MRGRSTIWVSAAGDANDRATWSGTTAHLIESAQVVGLPFDGLALRRPGEWLRRAWNVQRLLRTGRHGGFRYSGTFLDRLWRGQPITGRTLLSCYQLLPDRVIDAPDCTRWFYIDGTLTQLFAFPENDWDPLPPATAVAALARERRGYHAAAGVICHSRWAADSVIADYGVPPERVGVVVPGANLDPHAYARWHATAPPPGDEAGPLRLVFIGRYPRRKGLDRLLEALAIAEARGAAVSLQVIGCTATDISPTLAATPGVTWLGDIDKHADADRFLSVVAGAEVGALLSRAEFGGMVQREFAALGLAALGPDVHGAPEHAGPGALLIAPDEPPAAIADLLVELASRGDTYRQLRTAAWKHRTQATWAHAARRLHAIVTAP